MLPDVQCVQCDYRDPGRRRSELRDSPGLQNAARLRREGRLGGGIRAEYGRCNSQANTRCSGAFSLTLKLFLSHGDRRGGVQAHGRSRLSDVLQHRHPHPPSAGLLHHRLALAAGGHHRSLLHLPDLLLVRKT